jgi:hypothetical protein
MTASIAMSERPSARGRTEAAAVGDEVFVCRGGRIHRLNATAALVWSGCDGVDDLDTLVARLATEFDVDPDSLRGDVHRAVTELEAADLVGIGPESAVAPRLEPAAACSGCGPGPDFERHVLVTVDGGVLAVGADDQFAPALARSLADRVVGVVEEPEVRAAYGVVLPFAPGGPVTEVARLYRGPDVLARSRRAESVVRALLSQLGAHALPPGHALLEAVAVGRAGAVVLVPVPRRPVAFERAAARFGLAVADSSLVTVEEASGRAVVGAPWLGVDLDALDRATAARARLGRPPVDLPWGAYDIVGIAASAPEVGRVFGETGPTAPLGAGGDSLGAVVDLCARVSVIGVGDLAVIDRLVSDAR